MAGNGNGANGNHTQPFPSEEPEEGHRGIGPEDFAYDGSNDSDDNGFEQPGKFSEEEEAWMQDLLPDGPSPRPDGSAQGQDSASRTDNPTITWSDRALIALICAIFAALTGMLYYLFVGSDYVALWASFPFWMALLSWWITKPIFKMRRRRHSNERQRNIPVSRPEYIWLGDKLDRHRYIFTEKETRIVFADKLPIIQGIILIGLPVVLCIPSFWAALGFPGHALLGQLYLRFPWEMGFATAFVVVLAAIWIYYCIKEPPLEEVEQKQEQLRTFRLGKRRFVIKPWHLKVGWFFAIVCLWGIYRWPFGQLLLHLFKADPYAVAWLVVIPSALWGAERWLYYLGSYVIVTNLFIRTGSTGYFAAGNPKASMELERTTNATTYQTKPGKRLGYSMMKEEGPGQLDTEFLRLRIIHSDELENAITV